MGLWGNAEGPCVLPWDGGSKEKGRVTAVCWGLLERRERISVGCLSAMCWGNDRWDVRGCCEPLEFLKE